MNASFLTRACSLAAALLLPVGCYSTEEMLALAHVDHTPLAIDPTDDIDLAGWWSNGDRMLHLDATGRYTRYESANRYRPPVERGAWAYDGYTELTLTPYTAGADEPIIVRLALANDTLVLNGAGLETLARRATPPRVTEDELIGVWASPVGRVALDEQGRYAFDRDPRKDGVGPALVRGHQGGWRLEEERVILVPDQPNHGPFALERSSRDGTTVALTSANVIFLRHDAEPIPLVGPDDPAPAASAPASTPN